MNVEPLALSIDDAVRHSGIGRTRIYTAIREKRLVARKNGRHTVILYNDLKAFLESLPMMEAA